MKKSIIIYEWLCSILKDYPNKEVISICKNYIDDDIGYKYLTEQYNNNKINFEKKWLYDLNKTNTKSKKSEQDNLKVLRPPKL